MGPDRYGRRDHDDRCDRLGHDAVRVVIVVIVVTVMIAVIVVRVVIAATAMIGAHRLMRSA
ncbi:MAG: hypothetical protein ACKPAF_03380 [Actinomycetota bacterium]